MAALISVVIPVYNEAESLEPLVAEIDEALTAYGAPYEIVFVDDGSTDASFAVMRSLADAHRYVRTVKLRRNFGKAAALAHGFAAAHGDVIVTMDGDRQDDPAEIPRLIAPLAEGYDLVSGWKQSRQDPLNKKLPSRFFNWSVRRTTGIPLHDFNCGLKAYRREVVDTIAIYGELHRYIPVVAAQSGFRVTEVKVSHRRRVAGRSKYGWKRYLRGYLDLLTVLFLGRYQHRPQHLFGGLGTLLIVVGVLTELYLTIDKLALGNPIGQRPLLLLGALLIIVGVQLLSLGLIGELITHSRARGGPDPTQLALVADDILATQLPPVPAAAEPGEPAAELGRSAERDAEEPAEARRPAGPFAGPALTPDPDAVPPSVHEEPPEPEAEPEPEPAPEPAPPALEPEPAPPETEPEPSREAAPPTLEPAPETAAVPPSVQAGGSTRDLTADGGAVES